MYSHFSRFSRSSGNPAIYLSMSHLNLEGMSSDYVSQLFCRDILLQLLRSLVESLYVILPTSCSHLHYVRVS